MTKVLEAGALDASPSSRPKTIEAAKELLGAVRDLYEVERKKEEDCTANLDNDADRAPTLQSSLSHAPQTPRKKKRDRKRKKENEKKEHKPDMPHGIKG